MARKNPIIAAAEAEIKRIEEAEADETVPNADQSAAPDSVEAVGEIELDLATVPPLGDTDADATTPDEPSDVLDAFVAWAKSDEERDLAPFIEAGFLDKKHSLTTKGVKVLDANQIGWRTVYFLKLGVPMTLHNGTKLLDGSSIIVINGGATKDGTSRYWLCSAGEQFGNFEVYQHRLHQFWQANYPLAQKMGAKYTRVE